MFFLSYPNIIYLVFKQRPHMKKLILRPTKDSITICLPADWVGKPISCILQREDNAAVIDEFNEAENSYSIASSSLEEFWNCEKEDELWKDI